MRLPLRSHNGWDSTGKLGPHVIHTDSTPLAESAVRTALAELGLETLLGLPVGEGDQYEQDEAGAEVRVNSAFPDVTRRPMFGHFRSVIR